MFSRDKLKCILGLADRRTHASNCCSVCSFVQWRQNSAAASLNYVLLLMIGPLHWTNACKPTHLFWILPRLSIVCPMKDARLSLTATRLAVPSSLSDCQRCQVAMDARNFWCTTGRSPWSDRIQPQFINHRTSQRQSALVFADECICYRTIKSNEDCEELCEELQSA